MLSTGFDIDKIVAAGLTRLGWTNPSKAGYNIVAGGNLTATSGRHYNDLSFHASCTIQNLLDCQGNESITEAEFNILLTDLGRSILISSLNAVFTKVEFIESGLAFATPDKYTINTVANNGQFCGYRITVGNGSFAAQVISAHLLFDAAATFKLYLYRDFKKAPLKEVSVTTVAGEIVSVDVSEMFNYLSAQNKGGSYYLGYFHEDIGEAKAIDLSPCWNCYKVFRMEPVVANTVAAVGDSPRDFDRLNYQTTTQMRGMNLEVASFRDYTDDIIKALHQFDELRGLTMAAKVIEMVLNSTRSNKTQRISAENLTMLYNELNGITTDERPFSSGLKSRISKEVKRLQKVFTQVSKNQIVEQ